MLESVYLLLTTLAFAFMLLSIYFYKDSNKDGADIGSAAKIAAPIICALISCVLFAVVALGSYDVTNEFCGTYANNTEVGNIYGQNFSVAYGSASTHWADSDPVSFSPNANDAFLFHTNEFVNSFYTNCVTSHSMEEGLSLVYWVLMVFNILLALLFVSPMFKI